jgi:hypothetical protein
LPILHDKLSKEAGTRINGYDRDSGLACGRIFLSSFFCVCVCCYFVIPPPFSYFLSSSLAFSVVLSSQAANENSASEPLHLAKHHTEPHATTR